MTPSNETDMRELIDASIDETISPKDWGRLCDRLRSDAALRAYYVRRRMLHAAMIWETDKQGREPDVEATQPTYSSIQINPVLSLPRERTRVPRYALAIAASILVAACGVAIVALSLSDRQPTTGDRPTRTAPAIASVVDHTDTVYIDGRIANRGDTHQPGTYSIESGSAELLLSNRVGVTLTGKTSLTMHSPMSATLARGTVEFDCPPQAKGYTVFLPGGAELIDLGTRFVVDHDPNTSVTTARVTEGVVRIDLRDRSGEVRGSTHVTAGENIVLGIDRLGRAEVLSETVLIADPLDGAPDTPLDGSPIAFSPSATNWVAADWRADGSIDLGDSANAFAPFTAEPGYVYTLSCDAHPTAATNPTFWFAVGFANEAQLSTVFHVTPRVGPWMLLRVQRGPGAVQTFIHGSVDNPPSYSAPSGPVHLEVELDTTRPRWRVRWFVDHVPVGEPSELETNPEVRFIGFGRYGDVRGGIKNLQLRSVQPDASPTDPPTPNTPVTSTRD